MDFTGLPLMEFSFSVSEKGQDTGCLYSGDFVYKRLNYAAKNEAAKLTARLNGDLETLAVGAKDTNFMLGILKFGLIKFPDWWEESDFGLKLYDDDIIFKIYEKINKFEEDWHDQVWSEEPKKPKIKGYEKK